MRVAVTGGGRCSVRGLLGLLGGSLINAECAPPEEQHGNGGCYL